MEMENTINELIEIIKPYMSGLPCESENGSCELTSCRECRARELANKICNKDIVVPKSVYEKCVEGWRHSYMSLQEEIANLR